MAPIKVEITRETINELLSLMRVYALMNSEKRINKIVYYHLHIIRAIYHRIDKKYMRMIYDEIRDTKLKLERAEAKALCDLIDTVPAESMGLRDLRIELGKYSPNNLTE